VYHGRSGTGYCCGIEVHHLDPQDKGGGIVDLVPIASKGRRANCTICVPVAEIPKLIAALVPIRKQGRLKKRR
jgi:hypothetical protein